MDDNAFAARIEGNKIVANVIRGYQRQLAEAQAERDAYRAALEAITRLPIGAYDDAYGEPESCDRCGEAHDIAQRALEPPR